MATAEGRTWRDLVREIAAEHGAPEPTDEEADFILWERTGFPFGGREKIEEQVRGFFRGEEFQYFQEPGK